MKARLISLPALRAISALCVLPLAFPAALRAASPESEEYRWESPFPDPLPADTSAAPAVQVEDPDTTVGAPDLPHPSLATEAAPAEPGPTLALLPTAAGRGAGPGRADRETMNEALRLGAEQAGTHRILTVEETALPFGRFASVPADCFSGPCAAEAARIIGADLLLVSELSRSGKAGIRKGKAPPVLLTLALVESATGKVRKAVRAQACPGVESPIPFAQQAVWRLLQDLAGPTAEADSTADTVADAESEMDAATDAALDGALDASAEATSAAGPDTARAEAPLRGCSLVAEVAVDSGAWPDIAWLNPPEPPDGRLRFALAGSGLLAAGIGLAWVQGQLLQEDGNGASPSRALRGGSGAASWMRGFFAAPNPGARYAAMGGAGIAHVDDAFAVVLNPAGVADADREDMTAAKRGLPDGAPSFHLSYAGPLKGGLYQGLGVQHEGDELANETVLQAVLAGDWGALSRSLAGLRTGAGLKLYLAKVGDEGAGLERSTGHSFGMGLDLGIKLRLSERITGALAVRDAASFLRHANTFTDRAYWEMLPPEYRLGAAYQVDSSTLLVLDGQKGMVADQVDHLRLGAEQTLFRFLSLRAGLHQAFGREAVRKLAVGFGLDSDGISDRPRRVRIALDYAFDFGLGADAPLGGGQAFSMSLAW